MDMEKIINKPLMDIHISIFDGIHKCRSSCVVKCSTNDVMTINCTDFFIGEK